MSKILIEIGTYVLLMLKVFRLPEKSSVFRKQVFHELDNLGLQSVGIITIISVFMGAVVAIQTAFNIDSPIVPSYTVGFATRQSMILEFAPTIMSLILAGKVGSRIASEIGTMRVTSQIDALEIMGINAPSYLILPKAVACIIINPILILLSMILGIFGGWIGCVVSGAITSADYIYGIQSFFHPADIIYALLKTVVFAILIVTISGYYGYSTKGGALEVGNASTKAVVSSSIAIIVFNLILTQLLLT